MAYLPDITPQWIKITKSYSDFSAAALTNNIEIYSLPAKGVIHAAVIRPTQSFTGGIISAYTISVGINGNLTKYAAALNVFQAVTNTVFGLGVNMAPVVENFGDTTSVRAAAIAIGANLDAAAQGSVDIFLLVSKLP